MIEVLEHGSVHNKSKMKLKPIPVHCYKWFSTDNINRCDLYRLPQEVLWYGGMDIGCGCHFSATPDEFADRTPVTTFGGHKVDKATIECPECHIQIEMHIPRTDEYIEEENNG